MIENFVKIAEKNINTINPKAHFILRNGEMLSAMMMYKKPEESITHPYVLGNMHYNSSGNADAIDSRYDIVDYIEE